MFIVTLDGVEYYVQWSNRSRKAPWSVIAVAIGQATQRGQRFTKATKITAEWIDRPFVTPDP